MPPAIYLGLGTNLGDRLENLRGALSRLSRLLRLDAVSSVYRTEPVGYRDQPEFWNIVVRAHAGLAPRDLLESCKEIEAAMGRAPSFPNAPRVIDIDLLLYDRARVSEPDLEVPHPRLLERAFVLVPLLELEPEIMHPVTGERLADRLARGFFERIEVVHPPDAVFRRSGSRRGRDSRRETN